MFAGEQAKSSVGSREGLETYNFCVVCADAQQVFLVGDFNDWSTTRTPMKKTEAHIWQLSVEMSAGEHEFSYFVIDRHYRTGSASFGTTFFLPGTWAAVVRTGSKMKPSPDRTQTKNKQIPPSRGA